jgi:hypothetical protein
MLPSPVAPQRFEAIARWYAQVREAPGNLQLPKLPACDRLDAHEPFDARSARQRFSLAIAKRDDHDE